ncbi:GDSL-type esterase/lipase family protein [Pseudoalteromonas shioyasakiensis]|uniref:GDSL-type esterase/lipase family protein n=1 Tax=Pseudoalteromonas shioyasakiensis TaxID=1190813 RepID=UPI002119A98D|nr:GDSL-type esterase/lipase family protein [Pseudoalteromonas shioyasakiensis]MCQ8878712.1 GDSL-type esterase/lipase family protein [Pseudoalteromonas shioyasakiensis]
MNILCFGDSNTYGISPVDGKRLPAHERWPGILAELLGSEHLVIEAGQPNRTLVNNPPFSGDKSGLKYLKPYLEAYQLDIIIIQLGTNDLKARFELTAKQIADGLDKLLLEIACFYGSNNTRPKIVILSPTKVFAVGQYQTIYKGVEKKAQLLITYYAGVAQHQLCEFIDCYPLIEPCAKEGIHFHPCAHQKLASKVKKLLAI